MYINELVVIHVHACICKELAWTNTTTLCSNAYRSSSRSMLTKIHFESQLNLIFSYIMYVHTVLLSVVHMYNCKCVCKCCIVYVPI